MERMLKIIIIAGILGVIAGTVVSLVKGPDLKTQEEIAAARIQMVIKDARNYAENHRCDVKIEIGKDGLTAWIPAQSDLPIKEIQAKLPEGTKARILGFGASSKDENTLKISPLGMTAGKYEVEITRQDGSKSVYEVNIFTSSLKKV